MIFLPCLTPQGGLLQGVKSLGKHLSPSIFFPQFIRTASFRRLELRQSEISIKSHGGSMVEDKVMKTAITRMPMTHIRAILGFLQQFGLKRS